MQIKNNISFTQRLLGAVDLALDFTTLGEYGLEQLPANTTGRDDHHGPCCERPGLRAGPEPFAKARRGACGTRRRTAIAVRLTGAR